MIRASQVCQLAAETSFFVRESDLETRNLIRPPAHSLPHENPDRPDRHDSCCFSL